MVRPAIFILCGLVSVVGCTSGGLMNSKEGDSSALRLFRSSPSRLDMTPTAIGKKTNEEQLVMVTVYDEDGHPLSRRKIEWTIEGPGQIAAVDDGGIFVRGRKNDEGKSAVSATHSYEKTVGRKTKNKTDDFTVKAGQSWCVITSAVEGQTVLTATCPDIADRTKGRAVTKILWANSEYTFPTTATVRVGGDLALTTTINQLSTNTVAGNLRVRYRILGGAPASLISETSTAALSGTNPQEAVATADVTGSAGVRILQTNAVPGKTKVGIEVYKADPNGVNAGQVIARSEALVEWTAAKLTLDCIAPATGAQGRDFTYTLVVANGGTVESPAVVLRAPLPEGTEFVSADPSPSVREARDLVWSAGALQGGAKREYRVTVKPTKQGTFTIRTTAETADGQKAETSAKTTFSTAGIRVAIDAPTVVGTNEQTMARVVVRNTGGVAAENVTVFVSGGVIPNDTPPEYAVGTIAAGASRTVEVPVKATAAGRFAFRANVTADGGLNDKTETSIDVKKAGITLELRGPARMTTGEEVTFDLGLVNVGEETLNDIRVSVELPQGMRVISKSAPDTAFTTTVPSLAPNGKKVISMTMVADQVFDNAKLIAKATTSPTATRTLDAITTATATSSAIPVLALELTGPLKPVPADTLARYRVIVRNKGTGPTGNITMTVEFPEEIKPERGSEGVRIDGRTATYTPTRELRANESVTIYVEGRAEKRGTSTVRATVQAPLLTLPLKEEQATRVIGAVGNQ